MQLDLRPRTTALTAAAALSLSAMAGGVALASTPEVGIAEGSDNSVGGRPFRLIAMVGGHIGPEGLSYSWTAGDRCEIVGQTGPEASVLCEYVSGVDMDGPRRVFTVDVSDGSAPIGSASYGVDVLGDEISTGHDNPDEDLVLNGTLLSYTETGVIDRSVRDVEVEARWQGTDAWVHLATVQTTEKGRFTYRHYPLDRALDIRVRFGDATDVKEGIKVRVEPRVKYDRRKRVAVVTAKTVFGLPAGGQRAWLYQHRWVRGQANSMYTEKLRTGRTNARGKVRFDVPRWKPSPEYWVGLRENAEYGEATRCFRIIAPQVCG